MAVHFRNVFVFNHRPTSRKVNNQHVYTHTGDIGGQNVVDYVPPFEPDRHGSRLRTLFKSPDDDDVLRPTFVVRVTILSDVLELGSMSNEQGFESSGR